MLVSFALGQALSWRGLAQLGASLSLLPVPLLLLLPETPQHLTRTGTSSGTPPYSLNIFVYSLTSYRLQFAPPRALG